MSFTALIPMRGGSKSIPNKNIKLFGGKPLCAWVLDAVKNSKFIDEIYVSSDSNRILEIVEKINKKVNLLKRSPSLAKDKTSTEEVMLDFASKFNFDNLVTLQVTSPFTSSKDIDNAIKIFKQEGMDSLFTSVRIKRFFWGDNMKPLNYNPRKRLMRQDFKGTLMENGAFYITNRNVLSKYKCRLAGKIGSYEMPMINSMELDEIEDWKAMSKLIKKTR